MTEKKLRIHYVQHVSFEGPAAIGQWAEKHGYPLTGTHVYEQAVFPDMDSFDWLVIMGGPMGVHDDGQYPWMPAEKAFIRKSINAEKTIIGICLGAQLIVDALGARVFQNPYKEIGWFPVELTDAAVESELFKFFPKQLAVFHWHGDTFTLPDGAVHLAKSKGCENQAFLYNGRVLGLQFHLEATQQSIRELALNCKNEITADKYIQKLDQILSSSYDQIRRINEALFGILDRLLLSI